MESLKIEIEDVAKDLNEKLNQIEAQFVENKTRKDLIEKNIEDLQLKIDERFKIISESLNG